MVEIRKVAPLNKAILDELDSDGIRKKRYEAILSAIDERFDYIINRAMEILERKNEWYAYSNAPEGEDEGGEFDLNEYRTHIEFIGDIRGNTYGLYVDSIPTKWLFEDFEEALAAEFKNAKAKDAHEKATAAQKAQERKQRRPAVIASIKSKLTEEELSFVSFLK